MAHILQQRPQREQRNMLLKVIYTLESNTEHTLVARLPQPITVTVLPPPRVRGARARREAHAAAFNNNISESSLLQQQPAPERFAAISLKTCLGAICMASPDLVMDQTKDYTLYAVDALENYRNSLSASLKRSTSSTAPSGSGILSSPVTSSKPSSPHKRSVLAGKGYFTWALEEPGEGHSIVNGRIVGGSTYDSLFHTADDDDDEEEDDETLEIVLRLKEVARASRDQYFSILGGLHQPSRQSPSMLSLSSQPTPGPSTLNQISISRTVSDPNLMSNSNPSVSLSTPIDMGPPSYPTPPLAWPMQEPSPATHQLSAANTPAQDAGTPSQGMSTEAQRNTNDTTPGTQEQLLSLLQMLQQRQPSGTSMNNDLSGFPQQSTSSNELSDPLLPPPPLPTSSASSSSSSATDSGNASLEQQMQFADVLGGLADMMGITLPPELLPERSLLSSGPTTMADQVAASNAPTPQSTSTPSVVVVTATTVAETPTAIDAPALTSAKHTPAQQPSPLPSFSNPDEPSIRPSRQPTPSTIGTGTGTGTNNSSSVFSAQPQSGLGVASSVAHFGSAPSSSAKRGSLDAIAEQRSRKVRRRPTAGAVNGGESPAAGPSGSTSTSTSVGGGLGPSLLAAAGLVTGAPPTGASRAGSVDGGKATSVASGKSEKKERKFSRRAARERAVATAAANVAERERASEGPGSSRGHAASEAGPVPVHKKNVGNKLGTRTRKKADVRAGAAALSSSQFPPLSAPSSRRGLDGETSSSSTQQHARGSGTTPASRQIAQITFAQSSPIRESNSSSSESSTKVDSSSSFFGGGANKSISTLATPLGGTNSISRFSFPKHLLQSSPGTAFDALLSEGDLDFDGFAIPHGLFGSPSMIHDTLGGGGGGSSRHSRAGGGGGGGSSDLHGHGESSSMGRCPSTPLRRSPRKNPAGTHASMNPYATSTGKDGHGGGGGGAEHDLFGSDGESPLFGFVNMSPASGRGGSVSRGGLLGSGGGGGGGGDDDGLGGEGNDDPFASPSARRAQRRMPSSQQSSKGTPVMGSGSRNGSGGISLSALMVSPNLNEVDFAALLRTNLAGGGSGSGSQAGMEHHAHGSMLTGSPMRLR
ncbi:hypothetical protein CF326_g2986 [Tilletia indica]|nr:hypothetical protein CF326_g2986 [Tilletia indica]